MDETTRRLLHHELEKRKKEFWDQVEEMDGPDAGCLRWTGRYHRKIGKPSYGVFRLFFMCVSVHRAAWFYKYGSYPPGRLMNKCGQTLCCNPEHWEMPVPCQLKEDEREEIRGLYRDGLTLLKLANRYGCSVTSIWKIVQRRAS